MFSIQNNHNLDLHQVNTRTPLYLQGVSTCPTCLAYQPQEQKDLPTCLAVDDGLDQVDPSVQGQGQAQGDPDPDLGQRPHPIYP